MPRDSLSPCNISLVKDGGMPSKQIVFKQQNFADLLLHILLWWILANCFKVTNIHIALQFNQKPYMKMFIDTFDSKRSEVNSVFDKM